MNNPAAGDRERMRDMVRGFLFEEYLKDEDESALSDDTPLITGGILDSIGSVKLISYLEDQLGVSFDASDVTVEKLDSVARVVTLIQSKLSASENGPQ